MNASVLADAYPHDGVTRRNNPEAGLSDYGSAYNESKASGSKFSSISQPRIDQCDVALSPEAVA